MPSGLIGHTKNMATLRVAIDARAAKSGSEEYQRYAENLRKAAVTAEKGADALTKSLIAGFEASGVSAKKITPEVLAFTNALLNLKSQGGGAKVTLEQLAQAFTAYRQIEIFNAEMKTATALVANFGKSSAETIAQLDKIARGFEKVDLEARVARGSYQNFLDAQRDANRETQQTIFPIKFGAGVNDLDKATVKTKGFFATFGEGVPKVDKVIERIKELNREINARQTIFPLPFGAGINSPDAPRGSSPTNRPETFGAGIPQLPQIQAPKVFQSAFGGDLVARQKQFIQNTQTAQSEIDRLGGISRTTRSQISQLFLGFSAIFAIRQGIRTVIDDIRNFGLALSEVKAVTQATDAEFQEITQTAREIGVNSVFGATRAAEAMRSLAKAGFDARETLQTLPTVLDFATVAGVNLDQSAELLSKTLRQFQLDTTQATRAADALSIASNKTTTEVLPLSEALINVGPIAADLGNSLEDTTALLGTLAERGIQGGSAGTKLKGVLLSLISPSDQAKEAIESLRDSNTGARITLEQLNPAARSAKEIFETLANSTLNTAKAELIFQQRFAGAGLVLASGVKTTEKIVKANEDLRGETERVADEINNNLNGSIKRFSAAIEEASLAAGDAGLTGVLRGVVDLGRGVFLSLAGTNNQLERISVAAQITASAIKGLVLAGVALASIKLVGFLVQARLGFTALVTSIEAARIALISFEGVARIAPFLAAVGPAAFVAVAGLTAVITAISAFSNEAPEASQASKDLSERLKELGAVYANLNDANTTGNLSKQAAALDALAKKLEDFRDRIQTGKKIEPLEEFKIRDLLFSGGDKDAYLVNVKVTGKEGLEKINAGLEGLKNRLLAVRTALAASTTRDVGEEFNDAKSNLDKYLGSLELEGKIAQETQGLTKELAADRADILRATYKISEKAIGKEKDEIEKLVAAYIPLIERAQQVKREQQALAEKMAAEAEATKLLTRELGQLSDQVDLLKYSGQQRKIEAEVIRFANIAKAAGRKLTDEETATIRASTAALIADTEAKKAAKKEASLLTSIQKKAATALAQFVAGQAVATSSAQDFINKYKALAETASDTEEAQSRAAILARFDAKTKDIQGEAVKNLRAELVKYLEVISQGESRSVVRNVEELVSKYEQQAAALEQTEDAQRNATAAMELANITRDKEIANLGEYEARLKKALDLLNAGASKGRQKQAEELVDSMERELKYLTMTNDERERAVALYELERLGIGGKIEGEGDLKKKIEETIAALQTARKAKEIGDTIATGFTDALEAALTNIDNFGDAALAIMKEVALEITRILLLRPLANALASGISGAIAPAAKGNGYSNGNILPFANGGILDRPSVFGLSGGRTGVAGEAGAEGILPLKRNSAGKLGVIAQGSGSSAPVTQNFYITTPDANSFRKSQRQITQDARRFVR